MDLTKIRLPDAVMVSGKPFKIKTGHPYWFRFSQLIGQGGSLYLPDFSYLYIDCVPGDLHAGFDALYDFFYEKKELPRISDGSDCESVIDYSIDADLIWAAILQCYGIDLTEKEIHWHKVRSMLAGLTGTKLNEIIAYRCATPGKNKEVARMKEMWRLPERISAEDQAALDAFNSQFN